MSSSAGTPVPPDFRLGDWLVQPGLNRVRRNGHAVALRPKVMDVLVFLARHPGQVVPKEALLDAVWAKTFIADSSLSRAVFELREVFGDDPHAPRYIETIAKRGYRLVAAVEDPEERQSVPAPPAAEGPPRPRRPLVIVALAFCVLAATAGALILLRGDRPTVAGRSPTKIVVLPLRNLGAAEDEFFAAGISEEITNRLAKTQSLAIVSRGRESSASGAEPSGADLGRDFAADYVLRGTVRWQHPRDGPSRVRIAPQLVRCADEVVVWAETYERAIDDIFAVQSEISANVLDELQLTIDGLAESHEQPPPTRNIEAYQAYLRGLFHTRRAQYWEGMRVAVRMFERATELDPSFATAYAQLARAHALLYHVSYRTDEEQRAAAEQAMARALALDPDSGDVRLCHALVLYWCQRDVAHALDEIRATRAAVGERPGVSEVEGLLLRRQGRWIEAVAAQRRAIDLNPKDLLLRNQAAITLMLLRRYGEADSAFDAAIAIAPDEPLSYVHKAANLTSWRGDFVAAEAVLASAPAASDPDLARAWFWLLLEEGRPDAALQRIAGLSDEAGVMSDAMRPKSLLLADAYELAGDRAAANRSFEAARVTIAAQLAKRPDNSRLHQLLGLALAGLGQREAALREGQRGVELCPLARDAVDGAEALLTLAEIAARTGDRERAFATLETLVRIPSGVTPALLRVEHRWAGLRDDRRFAELVALGEGA